MSDILVHYWWVLLSIITGGLGAFIGYDDCKNDRFAGFFAGFFTGVGVGFLIDLLVILLGPALHFLVTVYFANDYCSIDTTEGVVIGASCIAGILLIWVYSWITITIVKAIEEKEKDKNNSWIKICHAETFRVSEDGNVKPRGDEEIYAIAIGNKTYYKTNFYNLVENPYYGECSERGKAKYKYDTQDIYVLL